MKKLLVALALCIAAYAGYGLYADARATAFAEAMREEYRGYRLEHVLDRRLVFLHAPGAEPEGAPLDRRCIEEVVLVKTPAADNTFNKDLYRWQLRYVATITPHIPGQWMRRTLMVPYFGVEPAAFVAMLGRELPGLDRAAALDAARGFERGDCDSCMIWTHPQFDPGRAEPHEGMRCTLG